jgi:hypothetical protein
MVGKILSRLLPIAALLALAACEFFTATPFPAFVGHSDSSIDLSGRISAIAPGASSIAYDLNVITAQGMDPRILLLVEPPSTNAETGFLYTGQLFFLDRDLNVLGQATTNSSLDYFSKPYSFTHDGNVLAGYTVLTTEGGHTTGTLSTPHGLEGFAFTNGTETYVFASPSGKYAAFDIEFLGYNAANWGNFLTGTLAVIPAGSLPPETDPNYANLGYQLIGLVYNSGSNEITFVLSEPAAKRIMGKRVTLPAATTGSPVLLDPGSAWPVASSAWDFYLEVDRPSLSADGAGFFLVRWRDGWLERYSWTETGALRLTGDPVRIVGDRSSQREYAFLQPLGAGEPAYMYRFDPASRILTRYRRWW